MTLVQVPEYISNISSEYIRMLEPVSFIENSRLLCLFTMTHTGSQLMKTILEIHPNIDICISESFHFKKQSIRYSNETIDTNLHSRLMSLCSGNSLKIKFYEEFLECRKQNYKNVLNSRSSEIEKLCGIQINIKSAEYLLFFCHANYHTANGVNTLPFRGFITTVRHPFLTVLSIIKRYKQSEHEELMRINEFIHCAKILWSRQNYIYVFINPWEFKGLWQLFTRLKLTDNIHRSLDIKSIKVNETIENNSWIDDIDLIKKDFIENGKISNKVYKYYNLISSTGLLSIYRNLCNRYQVKSDP
jgi:hypothetical protein